MSFLCLHCQQEQSAAKRKDSVNLLTQIKSNMLFIEMKKACFAIFMRYTNATALSSFLTVFHPIYFYFQGGKFLTITIMKGKNKYGKHSLHDSVWCCWMSTSPSLVPLTPLLLFLDSSRAPAQQIMAPGTSMGQNRSEKESPIKKQPRGWSAWRQVLFILASVFSFLCPIFQVRYGNQQWENLHFSSALVNRVLKSLILFLV